MALQHLRSSTANKRPVPGSMSDGQIALNTNNGSPGLYFKDSGGALVKTGPVHVGTTAPNSTAAGQTGNSLGEFWLDTAGSNALLKVWNGSAWTTVNVVASGTPVSTADTGTVTSTMILNGTILDADINASAAIVDTKLATISTGGKVSNSATTAASANTASAIVSRDASGNFIAGTITANLTGNVTGNLTGTASAIADSTVTSAKIVDGTIVNADINDSAAIALSKLATGALPTAITVASANIVDGTIVNDDVGSAAAIAGTKISPNFGSQNVVTTGTSTAASFIPSSSTIPANGVYLPSANTVAIATNTTQRIIFGSTGNIGINQASPGSLLDMKGTLRLSGSSSGYVGLAPAAAAGSTTYTLPSTDGSSGQLLSTNGSGTLSWTQVSSTSIGVVLALA